MDIPTIQEIKEHFAKAKEIRCLRLNAVIGVANVTEFAFDVKDNSWNGPAGLICFWKDGQFAEITKKKCGKDCAGCKPCSEKRKNKKNGDI